MSAKKAASKTATSGKAPTGNKPKANSPQAAARRTKEWFEGVIGQDSAKRELGFYLGNHLDNGSAFPNILFEGSQGDGKSYLARKLARNLPDPSDPTRKNKRFVPLDGSAIKNLTVLFEDICSTFANGTDYITVFVDECHGMPKSVQNALLTVTEPNRSKVNTYTFNDVPYVFDATRVTWLFATTEADRVFRPLRDRLHSVQLQPYSQDELAEIILLNIAGRVDFEGDTLESLSRLVRRNARHADRLADNILSLGTDTFTAKHLAFLRGQLNLLPFGITQDELRCITMLAVDGPMKLGHLASRFGKPAAAVQKEIEPYLIALGLLEIDGSRRITGHGRQFLKDLAGKK